MIIRQGGKAVLFEAGATRHGTRKVAVSASWTETWDVRIVPVPQCFDRGYMGNVAVKLHWLINSPQEITT